MVDPRGIDGEEPQEAPVTSGVPHGLVLGPILFLAFIHDLHEYVSSDFRLFADDTVVNYIDPYLTQQIIKSYRTISVTLLRGRRGWG